MELPRAEEQPQITLAITDPNASPIHQADGGLATQAGGGVYISQKGARSWSTSTSAGFGAAGAMSPAPRTATTNGAIDVITRILARIALSIFLLIILIVLAAEAIKLDGIAAPILGR